jgi:hypothetical protein
MTRRADKFYSMGRGVMAQSVGRFFMMLIVLLVGAPLASALDFEQEIGKQERSVTIRYKKAPHSVGYFMRRYEKCQPKTGAERSRCNLQEAKNRYQKYLVEWREAERVRTAEASVGEMQVSLEPKMTNPY